MQGPFVPMTASLKQFIAVDIDMISTSQKIALSFLTNISQLATFFSGVTATTLQMSTGGDPDALGKAVNFFYFASLFYSVAAAVQSIFCITWRQLER
jgi:hypothetical protein